MTAAPPPRRDPSPVLVTRRGLLRAGLSALSGWLVHCGKHAPPDAGAVTAGQLEPCGGGCDAYGRGTYGSGSYG